ncbi:MULTISPECIES: MerR family transcriptional regulator [unclassified Bacillus cereus group]|uniref:DUF3967 domain-containing protein n=1 Tax=unclassified Bacillus cereus group TaxID=2750818 RepID=UPI0033927ADB
MPSENEWITVSEVSERSGIPVETIRRYIRTHGHHLKVRKLHKKYHLHDECMTVIDQIRNLYAQGKNVNEVDQALSNAGVPLTITVEPNVHDSHEQHEHDERLENILIEMQKKLDQQQEFNRLLLDRLDHQQKYIEDRLENRDRMLMESIRQLQEEKQARLKVAATSVQEEIKTSQQKKWYEFWK